MSNINLLLTEREGRTGEYWPEVVAVRTERSEVRTKRPRANIPRYGPRARLVSSLLYGTLGWSMLVCFLLKRTSGHLNSKGFLRVLLMTRATKKEQATTDEFENKFNEHKSCWI